MKFRVRNSRNQHGKIASGNAAGSPQIRDALSPGRDAQRNRPDQRRPAPCAAEQRYLNAGRNRVGPT